MINFTCMNNLACCMLSVGQDERNCSRTGKKSSEDWDCILPSSDSSLVYLFLKPAGSFVPSLRTESLEHGLIHFFLVANINFFGGGGINLKPA